MTRFTNYSRWATTGLLAVGSLAIGGCGIKDDLLSPQQPGTITAASIAGAGAAGAEALRVGALGQLKAWTPAGGGSNANNIMMLGDLLTDVWKSGDTFQQHNETDQRTIALSNSVLAGAYSEAQRSRGRFYDAIGALTAAVPDEKSEIAEMYWGIGLVEMSMSEVFCNGVPLGSIVDGVPLYTEPLTNQEGFALSITHYDSALALVQGLDDDYSVGIRNAALVAKARTLVDMGQFAEAAALVPESAVPTSYQYLVTFSQTTQDNEIWRYNGQGQSVARMVVGDSVDLLDGQKNIIHNAIPFASLNDPRVPIVFGSSTDPSTVAIDRATPFVQQGIWLKRDDPIVLVSGIDARLIEAEARLQASDIGGMMDILNALRTSSQTLAAFQVPAMAALPTPANITAAQNLFFREKAFWQFARGTRLGDLRRLIRQYGRTEDVVFPTGRFHKNGGPPYGTDVNLPVTDTEKSNPNFHGCIDRNA
jgi:hypothetical protein